MFYTINILEMANPDQSQTNIGTTTTYQNWQHINWNYAR